MTPARFLVTAIDPALSILPLKMSSDEARAMVLAVCWQESDLAARRQKPAGPAHGYAQFEHSGGVVEVLTSRSTRVAAAAVCAVLDIEPTVQEVYRALEFQDVLMAAFARLLLWKHPMPLPSRSEVDRGWFMYQSSWRPGTPHPEKWPQSFDIGWRTVHERTPGDSRS